MSAVAKTLTLHFLRRSVIPSSINSMVHEYHELRQESKAALFLHHVLPAKWVRFHNHSLAFLCLFQTKVERTPGTSLSLELSFQVPSHLLFLSQVDLIKLDDWEHRKKEPGKKLSCRIISSQPRASASCSQAVARASFASSDFEDFSTCVVGSLEAGLMLLPCLFQRSVPVPGALPLDVLLQIPRGFQTEAAEAGSLRLRIFLPPSVWKKPWQNSKGSWTCQYIGCNI